MEKQNQENRLDEKEKQQLLQIARQAITLAVNQKPPMLLKTEDYSDLLRKDGASFVTLTKNGNLRGCIGTLEPYQPLIQDVYEHAVAAALSDYRFPPVTVSELPSLKIEISRLTLPQKLDYITPTELPLHLRAGIDGVVIKEGQHRATFLPQVWEKLPSADEFLSHLCLKMGAPVDLWQNKVLDVFVYQVEEFSEEE